MLYKYLKEKELKFSINNAEKFPQGIKSGKENATRYIIEFESAFKTGVELNDRVCTELFLPISKKSLLIKDTEKNIGTRRFIENSANTPDTIAANTGELKIIILLHGFRCRPKRLRDYYYFIEKAIEKKYAVLFLHLPYHLIRTPEGEKSGQRIKTNREKETLEFYNQSVLDVRKLIDVCDRLFLIQPEYFICGISLGGLIATITTAWEPMIKKAVLIQCGGNWNEVYYNSALKIFYIGNSKGRVKREYLRQLYFEYPEFLEKYKKISPEEIDMELSRYPELSCYSQKTWFLSDPLTFAHRINPNRVLMINSIYDIHFCRKSTELLHEELGRPQIYWMNNFHTTMILRQDAALKKIFDFFGK